MAAFMEAGVRLGSLLPTVGAVLSMDDVAEAHRQLEEGTGAGKTVVVV